MIVLGWDPGLAHLGCFVLRMDQDGFACVHRHTYETSPSDGTTDQRLAIQAERILDVTLMYRPLIVGYEQLRGVTTGKEMAGKGNADRGPLLEVCGMIRMAALTSALGHMKGHTGYCHAVPTATARRALMGKGKSRGVTKQQVRERLAALVPGTRGMPLDQSDAGAHAFGAYWIRVKEGLPL